MPHVRLERGGLVLREQAFHVEEAIERSIARGDRAGRVFGHREARDDLEVPGRRFEREEPGDAQIPGGERILARAVVGRPGLEIVKRGVFLLLCLRRLAAEQ